MTLRVIGAGLGRTGTASLKAALEQLLGGPCYHMAEVFQHPEHIPTWTAAARGEPVDWDVVFADYVATVDWPGASFWTDLLALNPEALVLLSTRLSAETWWKSANDTIFGGMTSRPLDLEDPFTAMWVAICDHRFTERWREPEPAMEAYERHNARVRAEAPADRLLEWQPGDGWEPLCAALGVAVPDEPFPHHNSTEEFRERFSLGDSAPD
jgi:hypothetical protein